MDWENDAATQTPPRRVVVPIAPPALPIAVIQAKAPARAWKQWLALGLAALVLAAATAFLSRGNARLTGNRVGTWLRHVVGRNPKPQATVTQRRLTANPGGTPVTSGVISPNGKYLAYSDANGFYVRHVDGGETYPVPMPKGFAPLPESWFPDSLHLVVSWFDDPNGGPPSLWKISVLGGEPRKLVNEGSSARVSPDGSKIAFLAGVWDSEQIWLSDADGGNVRKILDGGRDVFGAVAWAPDGKRFACVKALNLFGPDRPTKQIEVYDLSTAHSDVILSEPRLGDSLAWLNSGRLIYSLDEAEPNQADSNLWSLKLGARASESLPVRITNDHDHVSGTSTSVDGKRIALLRSSFQGDVYLADISARGRHLGAPRRLTLDERNDWPSSWTADNKAVLFISDRDGATHIFRQRLDQAQPELLVGGNNILNAPRLIPDGSSAIYSVSAKPGAPPDSVQIMRVPLVGGPSQFVLEAPGIRIYQCATSPSTLCIHDQFEPNSEYVKFFAFDPFEGKGTELLAGKIKKGDGAVNNWGLSPDGKYLATMKGKSPYDDRVLRIIHLADGSEREVPLPKIGLTMGHGLGGR